MSKYAIMFDPSASYNGFVLVRIDEFGNKTESPPMPSVDDVLREAARMTGNPVIIPLVTKS